MTFGKVFTILLIGFFFSTPLIAGQQNSNHYDIKLKLDPKSQYLDVIADFTLNNAAPLPDTLDFSLHRQFNLKEVSGPGIAGFVFNNDDPPTSVFMIDACPLKVILGNDTDRRKPLTIHFEYEGTITDWSENSANVVTEDWVELGMYLPWFPTGFVCGYFTCNIEAECKGDYQLRSFGGFAYIDGKWFFERKVPDFDINLVASKNLRTEHKHSGEYDIQFHYNSLQDLYAQKLADDLATTLELFGSWFGRDGKGYDFTVIQSVRDKGGDYARKGLIVSQHLTDQKFKTEQEEIIRNIAHEAAHFWWSMAPAFTWEDWLNESFAEYSALLVLKELFGGEVFLEWLSEKEEHSQGITPIWEFNRNNLEDPDGPDVIQINLYEKGPVLLDKLSRRIGSDSFQELCMTLVKESVSSTKMFLTILEKEHGLETSLWFEDLLKTY